MRWFNRKYIERLEQGIERIRRQFPGVPQHGPLPMNWEAPVVIGIAQLRTREQVAATAAAKALAEHKELHKRADAWNGIAPELDQLRAIAIERGAQTGDHLIEWACKTITRQREIIQHYRKERCKSQSK